MTSSEELVSVELLCFECFLAGFTVFRILETKFDCSILGAGGLMFYTDSQHSQVRESFLDEAKNAVFFFGFGRYMSVKVQFFVFFHSEVLFSAHFLQCFAVN